MTSSHSIAVLPVGKVARSWIFAVVAVILAPALTYAYGRISQFPIILAFPFVTVALIAIGIPFGLWRQSYSLLS